MRAPIPLWCASATAPTSSSTTACSPTLSSPGSEAGGHSTWRAGVELCQAAGARALAAFHHHTLHDDQALDAIDAELKQALPGSFVAREQQLVVLKPRVKAAPRRLAIARGAATG